jgi:hypothetical protein
MTPGANAAPNYLYVIIATGYVEYTAGSANMSTIAFRNEGAGCVIPQWLLKMQVYLSTKAA